MASSSAAAGDLQTNFTYIIVGGGIAGVTCAETLSLLDNDCSILLVSASPLIKAVTNFVQSVTTKNGETFTYEKLCICTGGRPKVISQENAYVIGIRDTETVQAFHKRLSNSRRVVIVGNGGIATEIVYEIEGCEVIWAIKDGSITHTFVDGGAATFFLPELSKEKEQTQGPLKRRKYAHTTDETVKPGERVHGGALGPDWSTQLPMKGSGQSRRAVHVEYKVEVERIMTPEQLTEAQKCASQPPNSPCQVIADWPVYLELTNGKIFGCDFIISATGVTPNTSPFTECAKFEMSEDGGLTVNDRMQTTVDNVYAAGDVCTAGWQPAPHWLQMRLWTQARQTGAYAAKCMTADVKGELDDLMMDFCFELFSHVTKFFNYKVVLLGKFNAQGLGTNHELLLRVTKGSEYVKTVMQNGRMQGALLIGDTDLEETFENLILNQLDLSVYGEDLLDPNIDIEDYFD